MYELRRCLAACGLTAFVQAGALAAVLFTQLATEVDVAEAVWRAANDETGQL